MRFINMNFQRFTRRLFKDSTQKHVKSSELVGAVWTAEHDAYTAACGNLFLA